MITHVYDIGAGEVNNGVAVRMAVWHMNQLNFFVVEMHSSLFLIGYNRQCDFFGRRAAGNEPVVSY